MRCDAAEALGVLQYKGAKRGLRKAIKDSNIHVQFYAVLALAQLGDSQSRGGFLRMSQRKNPLARLAGAAALYELGERAYLDVVASILMMGKSDIHVRYASLHTLLSITKDEDVTKVMQALRYALKRERAANLRLDIRKAMRMLRKS